VGVKTPKMTPLTSATMDLLKIGLRLDKPHADGAAHAGRLDPPAAPAGSAGRGQGQRVRRRGAAASSPGPARTAGRLQPHAGRRDDGGARRRRACAGPVSSRPATSASCCRPRAISSTRRCWARR
jgi:hypothetical protein